MADEKGRPAAAELAPPRPPTSDASDTGAPAPCAACGAAHGSVGVHIYCLSAAVRRLRGKDDSRHLGVLRKGAAEWQDDERARRAKDPDAAIRASGRLDVLAWVLEQLEGK